MNGVFFEELPVSRKRKINNTPIRMIVLSESATEEVKNDLFERINRGSDLLRSMEKRKGIYRGKFNDFIYGECAKNPLMKKLAPLAKAVDNRQEHEELILRFFALVDNYPRFPTHNRGIGSMLDEYMSNMNETFNEDEKKKKEFQYKRMLEFVNNSFPNGFMKRNSQGVSRVFFEALSVGVHLALEERQELEIVNVDPSLWVREKEFRSLIAGKFKTHTPEKIRARINFVKNKILKLGS